MHEDPIAKHAIISCMFAVMLASYNFPLQVVAMHRVVMLTTTWKHLTLYLGPEVQKAGGCGRGGAARRGRPGGVGQSNRARWLAMLAPKQFKVQVDTTCMFFRPTRSLTPSFELWLCKLCLQSKCTM